MLQVLNDFPLFLASAAIGIVPIVIIALFLEQKKRLPELLLIICGLAVLGSAAGFTGGMSRVGVVGEIIPAALALAGGVSVYLFGVDRSKGTIASLGAAAFALAIIASFSVASANRAKAERYNIARSSCYKMLTDGAFAGSNTAMCNYTTTLATICMRVLTAEAYHLGVGWEGNSTKEEEEGEIERLSDETTKATLVLAKRNCKSK